MSERHRGSPFFGRFSLRELIEANYPWAVARHSGGAGGAIGGGSGFAGAGKSSRHKSESYSCAIPVSGPYRFDEPRFIESLRSLIERELIDGTSRISAEGAPEPGAFYFDYAFEDLVGRVDVAGKLVIANYGLTSKIREQDAASADQGREPGRIEPDGEYYVVGISASDCDTSNSFVEIGHRLVTERRRSRRTVKLSPRGPRYADVFALFRIPPEIKQAVEEHQIVLNLEHSPDPWEEYEGYEEVYFLNENAVRMYREAGIRLDVLKTLSASELPKQSYRVLRGLDPRDES